MIAFVFPTTEDLRTVLAALGGGPSDEIEAGVPVRWSDAVLLATGIGKINATLQTERLLQRYDVSRVVQVGRCTALGDALNLGTLVGATHVVEGDRQSLANAAYPRMPLDPPDGVDAEGTVVTQDHTSDDPSYWQRIGDAGDASAYAVAFVAAQHGVPCQVALVVTARHGDDSDAERDVAAAQERLASFVRSQTAPGE